MSSYQQPRQPACSEVSSEAKKTDRSAPAVKKAAKKVGNVRKKVEKHLNPQDVISPARRHSGHVSPTESRTSRTTAVAASGERPGGGSCRAISTA
jgi:hypothetical protein